MEHPPETLANEPVLLRRWQPGEAELLDRIVVESLDHLLPWMPWAAVHTRQTAQDFLDRAQDDWASGAAYNYAITVGGGEPVGACSLMRRIGPGGMEIGYWIHPGWTGRGLVTRSAAALVAAAFALPGVTHLEVHHDEANRASGAVPRRLGFTVVSRRRDPARSSTPGESGVDLVQRLDRA
ncbi:GNAT family N-acetyltransferase [Streptacidiphilus cavernicola]|uniref:GNAT family N-acetyltransferase n=1 Tax=Streptacidiphilus cavernicola TaxID=3342716 RepID=A0ABV6VSS6_9ACTN